MLIREVVNYAVLESEAGFVGCTKWSFPLLSNEEEEESSTSRDLHIFPSSARARACFSFSDDLQ